MEKNKEPKDRTHRILDGLEMSYQKLVAFKKYKNSPLIVGSIGEVIEIQPDEIPPTTKCFRNKRAK